MKKLFLLFASSALAFGAQAQVAAPTMMRTVNDRQLKRAPVSPVSLAGNRGAGSTANKGTGNHTRTFNYVEYLALSVQPDIATVAGYLPAPPYLWYNNDIYAIYGATGGGVERDTIQTPSIGVVMHPQFTGYNSVDWPTGTMVIRDGDAYTVDSVAFWGAYGRNSAKPNIVDTVRIAVTYGNGGNSNIPRYAYTGMRTNYGYDTVRSGFLRYNPATHTLGAVAGGATVITKDILLRAGDTGSNKRWGVAVNMNIPAGNWVGTSITFRSGETYTPYSDTAFRGSLNSAAPFKYGMIRPYVYIQDLTGFPTYTPGNYNSGQFADLPSTLTENDSLYYPNWAWTTSNGSAPADNQFPYVDVVISCATCNGVGVKNVSPAVVGNAYPNPANNAVTLPITMKQAGAVNVVLTNLVGQQMAAQNLGTVAAGQKTAATFSTAALANGVYFLTVEANGARTTSRFVVTH